MTATVYLNGDYLPLSEARISVMDRGFLFADGVYESIPVFNGICFRLQQHLQRLARSLAAIQLEFSLDVHHWQQIIGRLISENPGKHQVIYFQITRGISNPRDHFFPDSSEPTVFIRSTPLAPESFEQLQQGIKAITLDDIRWEYCYIKTIALLPNVLLRQQAKQAGADEAILVNNGYAVEGAATNLFVVSDDQLITPPKSPQILSGITRELILELATKNKMPVIEQPITEAALQAADEIWLSSSSKEIIPVTQLNGKTISHGQGGPWWETMYQHYQTFKQNYSLGEL